MTQCQHLHGQARLLRGQLAQLRLQAVHGCARARHAFRLPRVRADDPQDGADACQPPRTLARRRLRMASTQQRAWVCSGISLARISLASRRSSCA